MRKTFFSICCLTLLVLTLYPELLRGQGMPAAAGELPVKILEFLKGHEMQKQRATLEHCIRAAERPG
jgi:hypothetical protein